MQTVTAADGTRIAYEQHGDGQPLVLLHGSSGTRESWDGVVPHLTDEFRIIVPDRRGRGASGDAEAYSLAREIADLGAVLDAVDGDATVFGHSFGGLVEFDGLGHVATESAPEQVAAAVRSFCLEPPAQQ